MIFGHAFVFRSRFFLFRDISIDCSEKCAFVIIWSESNDFNRVQFVFVGYGQLIIYSNFIDVITKREATEIDIIETCETADVNFLCDRKVTALSEFAGESFVTVAIGSINKAGGRTM